MSDGLCKLYELQPFLLPHLNALPYGLKFRQSHERILYFFAILLANDQEDGIIQLNYEIFIDDPRGIGKVFQPFIGEHQFHLLVISVFFVEDSHHLSQSIAVQVIEGIVGAAYPA